MGHNRGYHRVVYQRSTDNNSRSGSSGNDSQKASESDLELLLFLGYKFTPVWIHFGTDLSRTRSLTNLNILKGCFGFLCLSEETMLITELLQR